MRKLALITGAAKRIGAASARLLHQRGYDLVLHYYSSAQEAEQLAEELEQIRPESVYLRRADLLDYDQLEALVNFTLALEGGVDVLVNNASLFYSTPTGQVTERDWDDLLGANLKAPFFLSQALLPGLRLRRGCIVNMVDIHAEKGLPGFPVYSLAKAGLVAMTKCLARELAPDVRVNAVAPGAILWPDHALAEAEKDNILLKVPLRRCGDVSDIAKAVAFLVDDADYITGHVLAVDGGRMLFS
ncbi:MAG: pteridine reductase [Methylomonas sp.]|nr:pteridine reductase [Methylomonas sp.]